MKNLHEEIELFLKYSQNTSKTKINHKSYLNFFLKELSVLSETPLEEVHLEKIYVLYDRKGQFIKYEPIDSDILDQIFYKNLHKGPNSLRHLKGAVSSFFNYLYIVYDFYNPVSEITYNVIRNNKPQKILSRHNIIKFFHSLATHSENLEQDIMLFTLLSSTGCRISEITNIKVNDIFFEENTILLPKTKWNSSRMLILKQGFAESIKIYIKKKKIKQNDFLFNISSSEIRNRFHYFLEKANLPKVNLHSIRHSFATLMFESGADITLIQQLIGHQDLKTTKGYIHPNYIRNSSITIKENNQIFNDISKLIKRS